MSIEEEYTICSQEREGHGIKTFAVVKPDGGRYLAEIEQTLNERNILVTDVYAVSDWEKFARTIYQRQLQNSSRSFCLGFESHLWLCQYLFGNQALLLMLVYHEGNSNLNSQIKAIHEARNSFRGKFSATSNGTLAIAVNLDRLEEDRFRGMEIKNGNLGISQLNSFDPLFTGISRGRWFGNYFKYMHTPETQDELIFQFQKLIELNSMTEENKVSREEWEILKQIHCLIPPSKFTKKNK